MPYMYDFDRIIFVYTLNIHLIYDNLQAKYTWR